MQERAFGKARVGADVDADEPGLAEYRRVAEALRREPSEARLPSNFAWQVAQLAQRLPRVAPLDLRLERWLLRSLAAAMGLGALVAAAFFGDAWVRAFDATGSTGVWLSLLAACCALTALPDAIRRWRMFKH